MIGHHQTGVIIFLIDNVWTNHSTHLIHNKNLHMKKTNRYKRVLVILLFLLVTKSQGQTVSTFVSSGLNDPDYIAFDPAGNLYAANFNDNSVSKITPSGVISTYVSPGSGLSSPTGLAFDAYGNLFVANDANSTISEVDSNGTVSTFVSSGLNGPHHLAFDASGNLYVANNTINTVSKITPAGVVSTYVSSGLNDPRGIVLDASGNLFVANYLGNR